MKNNRTFLEKLLDGSEVEWRTIAEISNKVSSGGTPATSNNSYYENGNIPWLRTQEVDFKEIWDTDIKITEEGLNNSSAKWIPENCVIIAMYGATVGKIAINKIPLTTNQACANIEVNSEIAHYRYVFHYLMSQYEYIKSLGSGSQTNINAQIVKKIKIPIPPLSVQTEIVKILDALTALTSELTSELTLRRKQYEYYRETLLSPDNLEQLNTGGAKKKLSDVVNIYLGLTYTPTYVENGVKFISAQNTSNDFLDLSNTKFISREEFEKSTSNAKPKRGDILFTRVGSNLGHPVIVDTDEDLCIFVSLGFLRVKDKNILNSYIKHWMNTDLFWKQVEKNVHGSAKVNLNTGWLKNFEIYIPPLEEQQRIVSILDKFETLTNSITEGLPLAIEQSQKRYEYYRELLLNFS